MRLHEKWNSKVHSMLIRIEGGEKSPNNGKCYRPRLSMWLAYLYYTCLKSAANIETLFEILYGGKFFISKLVTNNELQESFFV